MPARVELLQRQGKGRPSRWLVILEGREIGLIERWNGADAPWFAYAGIGRASALLGRFYSRDIIYANAPPVFANGGRDGAIAAVVAACKAVAA